MAVANVNMTDNQKRKALLVIDLQEDFISSTGPFRATAVNVTHIISNLTTILPKFREQNGLVIWIKSNYSTLTKEPKHLTRPNGDKFADVPMNDNNLSGTHTSFPLCVANTDGERFIPEVVSLIEHNQDIIVTKTYYSAFTDTNLFDLLANIEEIHVCGLTTNTCIQATTTDSFFHGFQVFLWIDCLGYRHERKHNGALNFMKKWYATLITSDKCLQQASTTAKPVLYIVNGSIPSWRVMMALYEKNIDFEKRRLKVMSRPKETKSPEFLKINPRGLTPTFVDTDGSIIAESLAILHYLERYYPDTPGLLPTDKSEHIRVLQLIQESQNLVDIYEPLEDIVFKTPENEQISHKDTITKTLRLIHEELQFWETYLTRTSFIACNQFTLADCAFYPVVAYLIHRGLIINQYTALKNYVSMIKRKPSAINSHPAGWKEKGGKVNVFKKVNEILNQ